jgi:tetratricopeptide (TPR) repeat protein
MRRAVELAGQLARDFPDQRSYKLALARSHGNLGRLLIPDQLEEAEKLMREELRLVEETDNQPLLANALFDMGWVMLNRRDPEAQQWFRRAIPMWGKLGTQSSWYREMDARSLSGLGESLLSAGKPQEAAESFRRSADIWASLVNDYPSIVGLRSECAYEYMRLGNSLVAAGQAPEAKVAFAKASELAPQDAAVNNEQSQSK